MPRPEALALSTEKPIDKIRKFARKAGALSLITLISNTPLAAAEYEIGTQDDGVMVAGRGGSAQQVFGAGHELHSKWWRNIVYPQIFLAKDGPQKYKDAIKAEHDNGYKVLVTISFEGLNPNSKKFQKYFNDVMDVAKDNAYAYSPYNEPNIGDNLLTLPGKTPAQTYRIMYDSLYKKIKKKDPDAKVFAFETAPNGDALGFIHEAASYNPNPEKAFVPLVTDGDAHHAYQFEVNPREPSPNGTVGIGSLDLYEEEIKKDFEAGLIQTPDGKKPKTYITEFGYMIETTAKDLEEWKRAKYYPRSLSEACKDDNLEAMMLYQMVDSPAYWPGREQWNTRLLDPDGTHSKSFTALRMYVEAHIDCVEQ